ncbi:binary toxin-like calcium binding domain-containing protein [Enterococcus sp. DIV0806c]|uniref:binary toxin-like calcium binding domain-containing protein n=1 Tax=unclassified Enterococcus TaxID=2608891 RepID=UPI003F283B9A
MKKKWIYSLIATALLAPLAFSNVYAEGEEIEVKKQTSDHSKNLAGVLGYYYYGDNFEKPAFISMDTYSDGKLQIDSEDVAEIQKVTEEPIQSARWVGQIQIQQTGEYEFSTTDNKTILLQVDKQSVIENGMIKTIHLEKGTYSIVAEYQTNQKENQIFDLDLSWKNTKANKTVNANEKLLRPELDPEKREEALVKKMDENKPFARINSSVDTDDDGIYDEWEKNGYTIINRIVTKWDDSYASKGFTKYVSNPNHAHTARDPYTDFEKAIGDVDEGMKWEARDPLVAAVPAISVGMEKMILSRVINENNEHGTSESRETGSNSTWANTEGISLSGEISAFPKVSITGNYSHTETQSIESKNTTGKTWSGSIGLNKGETADLNANIRYYNTGTGVVYGLKPTVNFVLEKDTLATITAQINQTAEDLAPDEAYPERRLNGLALNTLDEFSSRLIPLNYEQVQKLDEGKQLRLETTQFSGNFVKRSASGGNIIGGSWDLYIPQIHKTTTGITLDVGNEEAIERRIAARNVKDPNDGTPELTVKEAIKKGFGIEESNGKLSYYHEITGKGLSLNEEDCYLIFDQKTHEEVTRQVQEKGLNNIYDVTIRPGMNIQIITSDYMTACEGEVRDLFTTDAKNEIKQGVTQNTLDLLRTKLGFLSDTDLEIMQIGKDLEKAQGLIIQKSVKEITLTPNDISIVLNETMHRKYHYRATVNDQYLASIEYGNAYYLSSENTEEGKRFTYVGNALKDSKDIFTLDAEYNGKRYPIYDKTLDGNDPIDYRIERVHKFKDWQKGMLEDKYKIGIIFENIPEHISSKIASYKGVFTNQEGSQSTLDELTVMNGSQMNLLWGLPVDLSQTKIEIWANKRDGGTVRVFSSDTDLVMPATGGMQ